MSRQERNEMISSRAKLASTVLNMALAGMQDDCPLLEGEVMNAISAAIELLSVPEVVA